MSRYYDLPLTTQQQNWVSELKGCEAKRKDLALKIAFNKASKAEIKEYNRLANRTVELRLKLPLTYWTM